MIGHGAEGRLDVDSNATFRKDVRDAAEPKGKQLPGKKTSIVKSVKTIKSPAPQAFVPSSLQSTAKIDVKRRDFSFTPFKGRFDWKVLHGVDVDEVVETTAVVCIEHVINTLVEGNVLAEVQLFPSNYVQLNRLGQLALEYVFHLTESHKRILSPYVHLLQTIQRWKGAACALLTTGNMLLVDVDSLPTESASLRHTGPPQPISLKAVAAEMHALHEKWRDVDVEYCKALECLEIERQQVRGFHFRRQRMELNWKLVHSVNVEGLMARNDPSQLERVMDAVMHGCLNWEDVEKLEEQNFRQLIRVTQCCLQYKMHQLNEAHGDVGNMETAFDEESTTVSYLYTRIEELWSYFLSIEGPPADDMSPVDDEISANTTEDDHEVPPELLEDIKAERKAISELRDTLSSMKTKIEDMGTFHARMTQQATTSPKKTLSVSRNSNVKQFVKQERLLGQTELRVQIEELKQKALDHFLTRYGEGPPTTSTTNTISIQVKPPASNIDDC